VKRLVRRAIASLSRTRPGRLVLWKALPACGIERLALRTADGRFMVSTRDNMIALELFLKGNFDRHLVEQSCAMASEYSGRTELTYLDVGANIGTNAVYALRTPAFSSAVCFEPDQENFSNLVQTISMSGIDGQVRCECIALGEKDGHATLERSSVNFGDHRIAPSENAEQGETVPVRTLDSSLSEEEVGRIGLVSVDVQGYEAQVLSGASNLLARDIPFLCELTPDELRRHNGFDRFLKIAEQSFNWFADMREPAKLRPIGELRGLAENIPDAGHTDVFLTKRGV
jgi:FkbM family methyltransferase